MASTRPSCPAAVTLLCSALLDLGSEVPVSRPLIPAAAAALAAALAISAAAAGQAPPPARAPVAPADADPIAALAEAERAFARETAKVGIRAGFLAWFAHDSIGFRPSLGNARDQITARPAPANPTAALLEWEPRVGDVAASGELGWLTGPSTFTGPDGTKRYGNYLSVWTRRPEGWRVFIDVGSDAPTPVPFAPGFVRMPAAAGRYVAPASPGQAAPADPVLPLLQAETTANTEAGFLRAFADEARYHRPGSLPLVGRAAIEADPTARASAILKCGSLGAAQARSGDLGYSYGRCELLMADGVAAAPKPAGEGSGATAGYYLRVWRRNASGTWQVVAHVDQPDGR
jgi:ketosteroid isomerase-like protein